METGRRIAFLFFHWRQFVFFLQCKATLCPCLAKNEEKKTQPQNNLLEIDFSAVNTPAAMELISCNLLFASERKTFFFIENVKCFYGKMVFHLWFDVAVCLITSNNCRIFRFHVWHFGKCSQKVALSQQIYSLIKFQLNDVEALQFHTKWNVCVEHKSRIS